MPMIYGYCRVSTPKQNIDRQKRNILKVHPKAKLYCEAYTGTKVNGRKELDKLLKRVQPGDTIVFDSASRMSRNAQDAMELYKELFKKGVHLEFLNEPHINTAVYQSALDKRIEINCNTGDASTDKFIGNIIECLNEYTIDLAEKQIQIVFDQSEKEVTDLRQRTKEGLQTAKLNGKKVGAEYGDKLPSKKSKEAKKIILKHSKDFGGTLNDKDVQAIAKISRNSFYKYKRELREETE